MELIKSFAELGKDDAAIAGGKGASLGEMTNAGIPVPPGFVILSDAFEKFLEETDVGVEIDAILHTVKKEEMHTVEHASKKIRALILQANMPQDIYASILEKHKILDSPFVAVRSSATAEDGKEHAWAGQLDSFLNTTEATLMENVQKCWASLFTPRAIFYRFEKGLHQTKISVAVVVQTMIESEYSGIAFSVHPVTEDRNQLIIEAGFGLGEAIVSGSVTPDSYVVEKNPRTILDINVNTQTRGIYRAYEKGNEWRDIPEPKASSQVLNKEQILELSKLIIKIENHYGFPCDIEWAYEKEKFYIVQSRPITTLSSVQIALPQLLSAENYTHIGSYKGSPFGSYFWTAWYDQNLGEKVGIQTPFGGWLQFSARYVFTHKEVAITKAFLKSKIQQADVAFFKNIEAQAEEVFAEAMQFVQEFELNDNTIFEDFSIAKKHASKIVFFWSLGWQLSQALDTFLHEEAEKLNMSEQQLANSLPHTVTPLTKQQQDAKKLKILLQSNNLWSKDVKSVVTAIEANPQVKKEFEDHLKLYGWILNIDWDSKEFTLAELVDQLQHINNETVAPQTTIDNNSPLKKYEQALLCGSINQSGSEYLSIFAHTLQPLLFAIAAKANLTFQELKLLTPEEILLHKDNLSILQSIAEKRKDDNWCIYTDINNTVQAIDDPVVIQTIANTFLPKKEVTNLSKLVGQVGNKGKAQGYVLVILSAHDFAKFSEGNILVTAMTTPDFILLMQKSAAIVTDMGGMLSHAAITSRELDKPCIIGTGNATEILKDGDLVEVDANTGIVTILSKVDSEKKSYVLHYTQSALGILFIDIIYSKGAYGDLDYILIFQDDTVRGYLTETGQKEAAALGEQLLNNEFFKKITSEAHDISAAIKSYEMPDVCTAETWDSLVSLQVKMWTIYRFCEEPAHRPLEKILSQELTPEEILECITTHTYPYDISDRAKYILEILPVLGEIKLDLHIQAEHFINKGQKVFEQHFINTFGISSEEFNNLRQSEVRRALLGESIPLDEVHNRLKGCIMYREKGEWIVSYGQEFFDRKKEIELGQGVEVKGTPAFKGVVRGKVVKHLSWTGTTDIPPGTVLVTGMTNPQMIPYLTNAVAIVTDEGGLTCHAAIISREMKIPCIVGTQNATILLNDGDMVEVDAHTGVVKIVKSI